jgi:hypothetical protein
MCNENSCCCRSFSILGLKNLLLLFALINVVSSFISIFVRAAKTERYTEALILLDERNKFGLSNYNYTSDSCREGGMFKIEIYCEINGEMLSQPDKNVSYQSLFRNFVTVELVMSITRTVITGAFLGFIFYMFSKNIKFFESYQYDDAERKKFNDILMYIIICLGFLIFVSSLYILIRALTIGANNNIGLYVEGNQNQFEEHTAHNYIMDIIQIVLHSISIGFIFRIKIFVNRRPTPPPLPVVERNPEPPKSNDIALGVVAIEQRVVIAEGVHPMDRF